MKNRMNAGMVMGLILIVLGQVTRAQSKVNDERMTRDIEVAENILSTLIKQTYDRKFFFPMEVKGNYMPGFGVTFRLPAEYSVMLMGREGSAVMWTDDREVAPVTAYSYQLDSDNKRTPRPEKPKAVNADSARNVYYQRLIDASKTFVADYGDLISQLGPDERILITNRGAGERFWFGGQTKRTFLSVEARKGDITDFRTGKITRDQMMKKIEVVNAESEEEVAADLELLSSIFNRLYREDLSSTYFGQEGIYYEKLKDFGVIYYMKVYSSREEGQNRHTIPTLKVTDLSREERDQKVQELYPKFEKEMKENLVEYGRTVKSLKPNETLVLNVEMTRCKGIPNTAEFSVANSVLSDYSAGKINKEAAIGKVEVKKGPIQ